MNDPSTLLARLDAIGAALARRDDALALIGLGSVGAETARLDRWSDLDFFAVVAPGAKARYVDRLDWLAEAHPLAWHFRNTVDGHKALMADGVFCEFAVFTPDELPAIPFAPGRLVWARDGVEATLAQPRQPLPPSQWPDEDWLVGEALSCCLVGLQRWHRGERLSALQFVQGHALERLIELDARRAGLVPDDRWNRARRLESRQPALAAELPALAPGLERTPQAALALLQALRRRGVTPPAAVEARIRALAQPT